MNVYIPAVELLEAKPAADGHFIILHVCQDTGLILAGKSGQSLAKTLRAWAAEVEARERVSV